jgi:adenosylcobyric acid synthase
VPGVRLDAEDGVSLEDGGGCSGTVAIVRLPHVSNFNEFDPIAGAVWLGAPDRTLYDTVIVPGTKNTVGDLHWMRAVGFDTWIRRQHAAGAQVIGVCGGFQILGETVDGEPGLGLLPAHTTTLPDKIVRPVRAVVDGDEFDAYEIHTGVTETPRDCTPFALVNGTPEGIRAGSCAGTYLHDALRSDAVLRRFGLHGSKREPPYDRLASWFALNANVQLFEELYL